MHNTFIKLAENQFILNESCLDIWQFSLDTVISETEKQLLSSDESKRAGRYYFERHQRRFMIARVRLRQILAQYLQCNPIEIRFDYNAQGKPALSHMLTNLQFNLSHSKELALLAVCQTHPIGIDLEFFSARPLLGIGKQLFSNLENSALQRLPKYLRPLAFFHIWSQKEALIKAIGLGLSYPTKMIDLPLLPPSNTSLIEPIHNSSWNITSFTPALACAAAVCHHPDINIIRYGLL